MTKFFLALFSLFFSFITLLTASAPSSPSKQKRSRSLISYSPKKVREPTWFKKSLLGRNEETWNVFGQWFDQFRSKPSGDLIHLKSIREVRELWSLVSTKNLEEVDRVDVSIFRPGFVPNFENFVNSANGFILSYKVNDRTVSKTSPASRNEAVLKAKEFNIAVTSPFRVFDPLINAAIKGESSPRITSNIIGFLFKRQYDHTFIQVFVDGPDLEKKDVEVYISFIYNFICEHLPTVALKAPLKLKLADYSSKISGKPSESPLSSPSKQEIKEEQKETEEEEEDAKFEEDKKSELEEYENVKLEEESGNLAISVESERPATAIFSSDEFVTHQASLYDIIEDEDDEDLNLFSEASDEKGNLELVDNEAASISSSSYETAEDDDEKNDETFSSKLSVQAPIFFPVKIKTIYDKVFDKIFTEDFDIFLRDQNKLMKHFEKILVDLVLEGSDFDSLNEE